jgi:hypothetical protein
MAASLYLCQYICRLCILKKTQPFKICSTLVEAPQFALFSLSLLNNDFVLVQSPNQSGCCLHGPEVLLGGKPRRDAVQWSCRCISSQNDECAEEWLGSSVWLREYLDRWWMLLKFCSYLDFMLGIIQSASCLISSSHFHSRKY